jgi:ribosomal protein S18 acetylase RimI-like enzyme
MTIRNYGTGDHDDVIALWSHCFNYPAAHNNPEDSIRRKTALDDKLSFVAESGKSLVGTVMAGWDGHRGWIYSLAVNPESRNLGIGCSLVNHAVEALRNLDCPKVNLQVMPDNVEVIRFYEKMGFQTEPRISMGQKLH